MKALIITWEKFQDHEVIYPYYRLDEEGLALIWTVPGQQMS